MRTLRQSSRLACCAIASPARIAPGHSKSFGRAGLRRRRVRAGTLALSFLLVSFRIVPRAGQTRFSQIEIALDSAQGIVVDYAVITEADDRVPLDVEGSFLQPLILWCSHLAAALIRILGTKFQLLDPLIVFRQQSRNQIGRKFPVIFELMKQTDG